MDLKETLEQLKALGDEKLHARNLSNEAGDKRLGDTLEDIRGLATKIKLYFPKHRPLALASVESMGV